VQHKEEEGTKKEWKQAKHKRDAEITWRILRASVIFGDQVCTMYRTYKLHSYLDILAENSCWKIVKHQREIKDDVKHQREVEERLKMMFKQPREVEDVIWEQTNAMHLCLSVFYYLDFPLRMWLQGRRICVRHWEEDHSQSLEF
jgi:hypothetical protein